MEEFGWKSGYYYCFIGKSIPSWRVNIIEGELYYLKGILGTLRYSIRDSGGRGVNWTIYTDDISKYFVTPSEWREMKINKLID